MFDHSTEPADTGHEGPPPPGDFPPPDPPPQPPAQLDTGDEPAETTTEIEPRPQGVDRGPVDTVVEPAVPGGGDVLYGIVRSTPSKVMAAGRAGTAVGRSAAGLGRAVSDRVFAGVPDVGDVAHMGATNIAQAVARAATGSGLSGNRWGRLRRFRMRCEP